jgi:DNA polymerase-1
MTTEPIVYILDVHYLIFRAYYALPALRAPDGTPVGAARGYAQTLARLLRDLAPEYVAAAADFALTSFRNDLYADYKKGRTEAPPDLEPQFALCEEVTRALGIRFFSVRDFEADDVIATLVRRLEAIPATVWIVTRDKDLAALASERVGLLDPAGRKRQGPSEIEARFGVPPELLPDYLALVGDPTDRIPGVRGVGASTARALLRHFGGINAIPLEERGWEGIDLPQPERVRRYLEEGQPALELSRELVRLRDDLPIDAELPDLRYRGASRSQLTPLLERLGFSRLLRQVPRWID